MENTVSPNPNGTEIDSWLKAQKVLEHQLTVVKESSSDRLEIHLDGQPIAKVPTEGGTSGGWRTMVNASLLPRSIRPEARRHLLYAVLQYLINRKLRLKLDTAENFPLKDFDPDLELFDDVYRVPATGKSDRAILFPIHVAVPAVFDTYKRENKLPPQTDKGFRGAFLEFFSYDETGYPDQFLLEIIRELFARVEGLTILDKTLVRSLGKMILKEKKEELQSILGDELYDNAVNKDDTSWWTELYDKDKDPLPRSRYRPLKAFEGQARRLREDIDAIAVTPGISPLERVDMVERLLAYHFSLYLPRLTNVLYEELDWAWNHIFPEGGESPWKGLKLEVKYHAQRKKSVPRSYHTPYKALNEGLGDTYLLLPVLNNIELAVRAVISRRDGIEPAKMMPGNLMWAQAKTELKDFDAKELDLTRDVLAVLAKVGRYYVKDPDENDKTLRSESIKCLYEAVKSHYTISDHRKYPKYQEMVFRTTAGSGSKSFLEYAPQTYVSLGEDLVHLLVLAGFEKREDQERSKGLQRRSVGHVRKQRMPLADFEKRLRDDLLVAADSEAREDLRAMLRRLGLIDRFSDVGEGNFLRHPTGI